MSYYDLTSAGRENIRKRMEEKIVGDIIAGRTAHIRKYSSDPDTYIRKNCYLIIGKFYKTSGTGRPLVLSALDALAGSGNGKIRQTAVYALGEIGKADFKAVQDRLGAFLDDPDRSVKNGLTGAIKQIGAKKPGPMIAWARKAMKKCGADVKKRILHGLELRGRAHPEDLLPVLKDVLGGGADKQTRKMLVHIIGQISYKKGCLEKVVKEIGTWADKGFVFECGKEIIKVHISYARFSDKTPAAAKLYLARNL